MSNKMSQVKISTFEIFEKQNVMYDLLEIRIYAISTMPMGTCGIVT
jgi:hypothetical protein